jgi:hypothetical protein
MRKLLSALGLCLLASGPAGAQILPPTPQQLQQQSDAAIQKSGDSLTRAMTQQQIGQIEQDQRRAEQFQQKIPGQPSPVYPSLPDPAQQNPTPAR